MITMAKATTSTKGVTTTSAMLPKVNLLPPEFEERRKLRRVQGGLAAGVLACVGVVGVLYVGAVRDVAAAQAGLQESQRTSTELQAQVGSYAEVPQVLAQVAAAEARVQQAMASEVEWSESLEWLATQTPENVWLSRVTVSQVAGQAGAVTVPPANGWSVTGIGTVTFEGKAYRHQDVATWMDTLATRTGFTQPYLTTAGVEEGLVRAGKPVIAFTSRTTVTEEALSNRHPLKPGS